VLLVLVVARPAAAQESPVPTDCVGSARVEVIFVGRVSAIVDDLVTFAISEVRSGRVDSPTVTVRYPTR
jgi:hypothetical protein